MKTGQIDCSSPNKERERGKKRRGEKKNTKLLLSAFNLLECEIAIYLSHFLSLSNIYSCWSFLCSFLEMPGLEFVDAVLLRSIAAFIILP